MIRYSYNSIVWVGIDFFLSLTICMTFAMFFWWIELFKANKMPLEDGHTYSYNYWYSLIFLAVLLMYTYFTINIFHNNIMRSLSNSLMLHNLSNILIYEQ